MKKIGNIFELPIRIGALLLVFFILITMGVFASQPEVKTQDGTEAAKYSDISGTDYENAVIALSELNILEGYPDRTFRAENNLSRAEFTAAVIRMLSLTEEADDAQPEELFKDVSPDHWGFGSIAIAVEKGLVNGVGEGVFSPDSPITYNQAIKILVCTLGYGEAAKKRGPYPYGYLLEASELGITRSVLGRFETPLNRGLAAIVINQTLSVPVYGEGRTLIDIHKGIYQTYYLSPNGSDHNPGTEEQPWKTLYKAAETIEAGAVVILEDGEYFEEHITVFKNSGRKDAPIVVKARNKHKAKIVYSAAHRQNGKFNIPQGVDYFTVQDIMFTQESRAQQGDVAPTGDIFIFNLGSYNTIRGNYTQGAFEEGIKCHLSHATVIEDNYIEDMNHEGIDLVNCSDMIIRNNIILETGRVGIMVKGGSRDCLIYNNFIRNEKVSQSLTAITVGGSTDNRSPLDIKKGTGFEQYNCQVYNNVIYSENKRIRTGLGPQSSKGCRIFNNTVVGANEAAVRFFASTGLSKGWEWNPPVVDLEMYNNIFLNCTAAYQIDVQPESMISDYNLFFQTGSPPSETHSIYESPSFIDKVRGDLRLQEDSAGIGKGFNVPIEYTAFDGQIKTIIPVENMENSPAAKWNIGAYQISE